MFIVLPNKPLFMMQDDELAYFLSFCGITKAIVVQLQHHLQNSFASFIVTIETGLDNNVP